MPLLSTILWLPFAGAIVLAFFPRATGNTVKGFGLAVSVVVFVASLGILRGWEDGRAGFQFVESLPWIPQWGITYGLGIDGISLWLVLLTTFLTPLVFLSSWNSIHKHPKEYVIAFLVMETAMIGAFIATDLLLFYVFFELMLLPMYLIIGVWGGANRIYAAIKFFLFTIAGSLLMLLAIIYLAFQSYHQTLVPTFTITDLYGIELAPTAQLLLFFAFSLAFAIKVPLFPLHTWLPDAHVEAPTGGSIILAGVMLKMGTYGFLRFVLPFFPEASARWAGLMITLSVIGIVYGALVAWVQPDMKKLVAYSSVSHLGFCVLGIFAMNQTAIEGSILQMVNHGLSTGALFLLVGVIYERRHTRLLADYGGIGRTMPVYTTFFVIAVLSSVGLPGLNGFIGEFLILAGAFQSSPVATVIAASGVILAAIYLLWLVQKVFFGPITNEENRNIPDIAWNEVAALVPIVIMMVWIGVHPNTFLKKMEPSVKELIATIDRQTSDEVMVARGEFIPSRSEAKAREPERQEPGDSKSGSNATRPLASLGVELSRGGAMTLQPLLESGWVNAILPEIILTVAGMVLILVAAFAPRAKFLLAPLALVGFITAAWTENLFIRGGHFFGGTYEISPITMLFDLTFLLAGMLATLFAREYLEREGIEGGEFYALLLWGTVGMMMMAKGLDLLIVILGLEILSICIFVLLGYHRRMPVSNEASLKYFLMGAFATGFILYGTALFYGATGSTNVTSMARWFATNEPTPLLSIAFVLLMSGFGFKLALAPFHPWAPDVYQGAPTPVAGWLSVAPKAATLIALVRLFDAMAPMLPSVSWMTMVAALAILSMIVGNAVAIVQRDLKRMLAYSGIAHVGYMMIAMLTITDESVAAVAVYTITYALMNIGAFGVVSLLIKNENDPHTLDDIAGMGFRRKFFAFALAICMFSLSGLPPTAGFISKFYIFKTAIESGHTTVALIGILASIISVYYYLRVVYYLYMKEPAAGYEVEARGGVFALGALTISVVGILAIGIWPTPLFHAAGNAARMLLRH